MATFGKFDTTITVSDTGKDFDVSTPVAFLFNGKAQTGKIKKQLRNSAVVNLDKTPDNSNLITKSNGVVIINYKELRRI